MKLKMLKTCLGSPDGRRVVEYLKGETYDLPAELAQTFVSQRWARGLRTRQRTKNAGSAPENKTKLSRKSSGGRAHGS